MLVSVTDPPLAYRPPPRAVLAGAAGAAGTPPLRRRRPAPCYGSRTTLLSVRLPPLLRMPPPSAVVDPAVTPAVPSSWAMPPLMTRSSNSTCVPGLTIWKTRSRSALASMMVALAPDVPCPWMISLWAVLVMSRSPVAAAFSWTPPDPGASASTCRTLRLMVSVAVPASALSAMMAARRLPLPAPPSVKIVGVMVDRTVRSSRNSSPGSGRRAVVGPLSAPTISGWPELAQPHRTRFRQEHRCHSFYPGISQTRSRPAGRPHPGDPKPHLNRSSSGDTRLNTF